MATPAPQRFKLAAADRACTSKCRLICRPQPQCPAPHGACMTSWHPCASISEGHMQTERAGRLRTVLQALNRGFEQRAHVHGTWHQLPHMLPRTLLPDVGVWNQRWTVVLLCFVSFMLCNMDRVNMSVAILPMSQQYGWDAAAVGLVQSSFFCGYLLTNVAGGIWADCYGGKLVLGLGVLWWSVATALTPAAADLGLPALLAARALMGMGQGVAMPAMNSILSRWVPKDERGRSLSLVYSGMALGSVLGLWLSLQIMAGMGVPSVFIIFGALGMLWYWLWQANAASSPSEHRGMSPSERSYILASTSPASAHTSIPWRELLSRREVWAIIVCHFCNNWSMFLLLTCMPTYFNQVLGLSLGHSGLLSAVPWVVNALMTMLAGGIADTLLGSGTSVTTVRKVMQTVGFLGPAFFLSQLDGITSVPAAAACLIGAQGLTGFSHSGLYSNHQDIAPRFAGVLLGLSNTAGVLAGVLVSLTTGHLLMHASWSEVWRLSAALCVVGTVVWNTFATGERIFE